MDAHDSRGPDSLGMTPPMRGPARRGLRQGRPRLPPALIERMLLEGALVLMLFVACAPPLDHSNLTQPPATHLLRQPTPVGSMRPAATAITPSPAASRATPPASPTAGTASSTCPASQPSSLPGVVFTGANPAHPQPKPNEIALTFDDGPAPHSTPAILAVLERTHTPATFFLVGRSARAYPDLVRREAQDGFAVGVHTWSHPRMTSLSPAGMRAQLSLALDAIAGALGGRSCVWLWRPPYGAYNARVLQVAHGYGLTTILWDEDPRDWSRPGTQAIVARVLAHAHPGAIIIMHDGPAARDETAAALPAIIAGLHARGLTPVTVPTLLADGHYNVPTGGTSASQPTPSYPTHSPPAPHRANSAPGP